MTNELIGSNLFTLAFVVGFLLLYGLGFMAGQQR
jgi:hypothetical protein